MAMHLVRPLTALVLAASGPAQLAIEATFVTDSEWYARAYFAFAGEQENRLPRGTDLTGGAVLTAELPTGGVTARFTNTRHGLRAAIEERHVVSTFYSHARTGEHDARLVLRSEQPTLVRLRVAVAGMTAIRANRGVGSSYSAAVDVGDDGSVEVQDRGAREFLVTLDTAGLAVRTRSGGLAGVGDTCGPVTGECSIVIEVLAVEAPVAELSSATPLGCCTYGLWAAGCVSVPAGTPLWPDAALEAASYCPPPMAAIRTSLRSLPERIVAVVSEEATLRPSASYQSEAAVIPEHDLLLQVRSARAQPVRLAVSIIASNATAAASWCGAIDVDDDGAFDLVSVPGQTVRLEVAAVLDARGLRLRTRSQGDARTRDGGTARGTIQIEVLPALACTVTPRGDACGARLAGLVSLGNRLELDLTAAPPAALGKLILGTSRVNQPLPFSPGCRLHTDPIAVLPFVTDPTGTAAHGFDLPPQVPGTITVQTLLLTATQPLRLGASGALDVECR